MGFKKHDFLSFSLCRQGAGEYSAHTENGKRLTLWEIKVIYQDLQKN